MVVYLRNVPTTLQQSMETMTALSVNINKLADEIRSRYPGQEAVFVRADGQTKYEVLAQVLAALGKAKLAVNLVTQPDSGGR